MRLLRVYLSVYLGDYLSNSHGESDLSEDNRVNPSSHGFFLVDKESGISSAKALNPIKRFPQVEKVGHAGTLDPLASGLLVVGVNRATRLLGFVQLGIKRYSGTFKLGFETDTYDILGAVSATYSTEVPAALVIASAASFVGVQQQQPPVYSALKVDGVASYERARRGEAVELASRKVTVEHFEVSEIGVNEFSFTCKCSTGTYVRSLIFDLGRKVGSGACLTSLRRDGSLPFSVNQAQKTSDLTFDNLIPWWEAFDCPRIRLVDSQVVDLWNGRQDFLQDISGMNREINGEISDKVGGSSPLLLYTTGDGKPAGLLKNLAEHRYELLLSIPLETPH